ncbi:uncharacterized protein CDV56_106912 [Aspergillus thermomutatus]|uniref:Major facilitator superfamily (MFS) profile domain-containing protein n=1 Tax=Aspergillus thermomutatus TaxID=41047 RepID=A0A397GTW1_ASPTH|nr:uncharacterized protein CDV56_106912 [Aspergillus thermomutatus]RHZ54245.1 hypothetical protein CDV56_106912 [Aspergillus thermomutatus]
MTDPRETETDHGSSPRLESAYLAPMTGWRLWVTILALFLGLLLSTLETTIVSTALVTIASELGNYDKSNWIVVSYLFSYTGFLIIYARCSDIFGRKSTFLSALVIFTVFSIACGVARTIDQLIVFRALQGIGGAGIYSMAMAVMAEVTPVDVIGPVTGLMSSIFALSSILGPILGGVLTSRTTWRWVFYLNIPGGGLAIGLVIWVFPRNYGPLHISISSLNRLDWPGIVLSLAGSIFLILALEEGGGDYGWNSGLIIASFALCGICWIAFTIWEVLLGFAAHKKNLGFSFARVMLPVFPVWLIRRRIVTACLLSAFLAGFPFMVLIVYLPQRFQIQDGLTPVASGIRMLPLLLLSAFGAGLGGMVNSRKNISFYTLLGGVSLQLLGLGLMTTLPTAGSVSPAQYGYQVILGLGFGLTLTSLVIISRLEVDASDLAIMMGAVTQVRVLGGTVGVSIGQTLLTRCLRRELPRILSPHEMSVLLLDVARMADLSPTKRVAVGAVYGHAFNQQIQVVLYLTGACWICVLGTFKRRPVEFKDADRMQPHNRDLNHAQEAG